ncbi:hypothetical protein [Streptomyces lydicus]|uniref:hypothetical protein n=1 Tax=Streptomyces lydicus TaxID=47763 RepID=UPI001FCB39DE|nr:hypothetical protein [Streptomyces lydicus]
MTVSGALALCAVTAPTAQAAQAASPTIVPCSEGALVNAIDAANAAGGGTLILAPFCTYSLTSAHGGDGDGPSGLPNITSPISMTGLGTTITRDNEADPFRIIEVDGPSHEPSGQGQLTLTTITVRNGDAGDDVGGGIANFGGHVILTASTVRDNGADLGGGIYTDNALTLTASGVHDNTAATDGGGIYKNSGSVSLLASPIVHNSPNNCGANPPAVPDC